MVVIIPAKINRKGIKQKIENETDASSFDEEIDLNRDVKGRNTPPAYAVDVN